MDNKFSPWKENRKHGFWVSAPWTDGNYSNTNVRGEINEKASSILLTLVFVLSVSVCALAAPAVPALIDVPGDHWAYQAVEQLTKAGIIDGYGDKTFKGDKLMSRYEMAQIVEKAINNSAKANAKQKLLIDKLGMEFALEINKVNTRITKLEEYNKNLR